MVGTNTTNGNGANCDLTGHWNNTSDSTKKFNIKGISYGLNEIMKLRPVNYQWKGNGQYDFGFIAQQVKLILPEIVAGKEGHMTISYGQITAVLTKAVQEQQSQIEAIRIENEKLQNQVLDLRRELDAIKAMLNK